jgi:hypothetical protein
LIQTSKAAGVRAAGSALSKPIALSVAEPDLSVGIQALAHHSIKMIQLPIILG